MTQGDKNKKKAGGFAASLKALGEKGLTGFGADSADSFTAVVSAADAQSGKTYVQAIDVTLIDPSPHQNRPIDEDWVATLATSIEAAGLGDPIRLRPNPQVPGRYLLIAGEHRWRAHLKLGRQTVDSMVLNNVSEADSAQATLIENLLRKDLTPLQTAEGLRTLIDSYSISYQQVATALGKSKTWVTSHMGILKLPSELQDAVREGKLRDYTVISGMNKLLEQFPDAVRTALAAATIDSPLTRAELQRIERASAESSSTPTTATSTTAVAGNGTSPPTATTVPPVASNQADGSGEKTTGDGATTGSGSGSTPPAPSAGTTAPTPGGVPSATAGASGPAVRTAATKAIASSPLRVVVGLSDTEGPLGLLVIDDQELHPGHVSVEMPMGEVSSFPLSDLRILGFRRL